MLRPTCMVFVGLALFVDICRDAVLSQTSYKTAKAFLILLLVLWVFFLICPLQLMTWFVLFWVFSWHFQEGGWHSWEEVTSPLGTSRDLHSSTDTCRSPRVPESSTPNSSARLFNHQSLCSHVLVWSTWTHLFSQQVTWNVILWHRSGQGDLLRLWKHTEQMSHYLKGTWSTTESATFGAMPCGRSYGPD